MGINKKCCGLLIVVLLCVSALQGENWQHWRGPDYNGSTDEKGLASRWSVSEGVAWKAELPGPSAATPIVYGDRVFISSVDSEREMLLAMCFDRTNGELLWKHDIGTGVRKDRRSYYAAPSPVTDGEVVVFFYSSGQLVCYDVAGEKKWARNIQEDYGTFAFQWTFSSSPVLEGGRLYLQILQRDVAVGGRGFSDRKNESYILAMNPETGKTLWRQIRESKAVMESREAFTTPVVATLEGQRQLLIIGGDTLTGHDLETGEELWRWGTWNPGRIPHWRHVPSPVTDGSVVLVCAPKGDPVYAIKPGGEVAWTSEENVREVSSDVPTPAFYDGDFFILNDLRKHLSRVEPSTGKVKWTVATPGRAKYEASPLAADGKIYIINHSGEVAVINAADGEIISVILMDETSGREVVRASISASQGQLFIRTTKNLYCVGQ